jgi:DNA end-binding protein Ku
MRPIWKGSISFGLVNIPITLYPATRREELRFKFLRKTDLSPINNKRVAEVDGKEVDWEDIVRGYEYEKGKFVVIKEEDFARVDVEATQTVDIQEFVELEEINPMFFNKPYYMEPAKGAGKSYGLLHDALRSTNKVGIAKVVIKTRQHLAGVKAQGHALVLELMHFAEELIDESEFDFPKSAAGKKELEMARQLIGTMTGKWNPESYKDDYKEELMKVIEEKVAAGGKHVPSGKKPVGKKPTNVIDLVKVLEESLRQNKTSATTKKTSHAKHRKKAA